MVLLLRHLTPEQQTTLLQHNYFDTTVRTKRSLGLIPFARDECLVRFHNVRHGYVETKDAFWCTAAVPVFSGDSSHWVPVADETLTKKMVVEADPERFFNPQSGQSNRMERQRVAWGGHETLLATPIYSHELVLRDGAFFSL
jgi:hypothetical protein